MTVRREAIVEILKAETSGTRKLRDKSYGFRATM